MTTTKKQRSVTFNYTTYWLSVVPVKWLVMQGGYPVLRLCIDENLGVWCAYRVDKYTYPTTIVETLLCGFKSVRDVMLHGLRCVFGEEEGTALHARWMLEYEDLL